MRLLLFLLISGVLYMDGTEGSRKDKERKKDRYKTYANNNPCKIESHKSPITCFCNPDNHPGNATKIECWIFAKDLTEDYSVWGSFSSQPRVEEMKTIVRHGGLFTFIPTRALEHLKNLKVLEVIYGSIEEVHPYAFANLTQLQDLKLTRNQIVSLSHHAFAHLPNLTELNLDENRISELKRDVFVDLPNLQKFYVTQNNLSVLQEGTFRHLTHLLELELSSNYINVLTKDTFTGLSELKRLDLNNNSISMLGDLTFAELWDLEELLLESNKIAFVSDRAFAGLTHLKQLNLGYNRLTTLSSHLLDGVPAISYLDLRANNLETLTFDNVKPIIHNLYNASSYLYIADNRFICDCRLAWMYNLKNDTKNKQIRTTLEELTCKLQTSADFTAPPYVGLQIKNSVVGNEDVYDDSNANQRDGADDSSSLRRGDSDVKHLFSLPVGDLPCPQTDESTEQPPYNYLNTPAYAEINSGCVRPAFLASTVHFFTFLLFGLT